MYIIYSPFYLWMCQWHETLYEDVMASGFLSLPHAGFLSLAEWCSLAVADNNRWSVSLRQVHSHIRYQLCSYLE